MRHCKICKKPMDYNFATTCTKCSRKLKQDGYHHHRIRLGSVGKRTKNYQQHLHTKFFGCNAPVNYRGMKENRVYNNLDPAQIRKAELLLARTLHNYLPHNLLWIYKEVKHLSNFDKRLVYNIVLYTIDYHILHSREYLDEDHYTASMIQTTFNHILRSYCRINREWQEYIPTKLRVKRAKNEKVDISNRQYVVLKEMMLEVGGELIGHFLKKC